MMNDAESMISPVEERVGEAANDFFAALARGDEPSISEFCERYPDIAEHIRRTFPALLLVGNSSNDPDDKKSLPVAVGEALGTLGDFRLIREIARGGMGVVYEAEQLSLRRRVALKVLPFTAVLDKQQLARFQSEAYAAATLHHPHIVPVYAVGSDRGVHFYAMQYIEGRSLTDLLVQMRNLKRQGESTVKDHHSTTWPATGSRIDAIDSPSHYRRVAELGIEAAGALEYSHAHGIVHRDVKPANLLIDDKGKLWVTDFGLARVGGDAGLTMTGDLLGTARYMSPEQVLGQRTKIDYRTDIYSLGATLYELLSLQPAFDGDERAGLLRRIAEEEPPRLRQISRLIPLDLETIVGKAMEKFPADRYASAQALADDLGRYLASEPIKAKPASRAERIFKWSRRHHSLIGIGGLSLLLLSLVLAVSAFLINRARVEALAALDDKSEQVYFADMTDAFTALEKGWSDEVRRILDRQRPVDNSPDRRGLGWFLLDSLSRQPLPTVLSGHTGAVNEIAVFPDHRRLASVGRDGTVRIWDLDSSRSTIVAQSDEELQSVAISPDGRYLAAGGWKVQLIDTNGGSTAHEIFCGMATIQSLAFSPDGKTLAAGSRYEDVTLHALDGKVIKQVPCAARVESLEYVPGRPWLLVPNRRPNSRTGIIELWRDDLSRVEHEYSFESPNDPTGFTIAKISPCGRYIAASQQYKARACIFDLDSGQIIDWTPDVRDEVTSLAYSPDGESIALGCLNGVIEYFELERSGTDVTRIGRRLAIDAHQGCVTSIQYISPDRIATCGSAGLVKLWDRSPVRPRRIPFDSPSLTNIEWSPDGKLLACATSGGLALIDNEGTFVSRAPLDGIETAIAWSPLGDRVAISCDSADQVTVHDRSGQKLFAVHLDGGGARATAFSPDGHTVAAIGLKQLRLCDTDNNGAQIAQIAVENGESVAFSHDGQQLAYGGGFRTIIVKDSHSYRDIFQFPCRDRRVESIVFSPDDSLLAAGLGDGAIQIWDLRLGALKAELAGHERFVRKMAFSPDGRSLLSASEDGTLRIWSLKHQREIGIVQRVSNMKTAENRSATGRQFSLSNDGRRLAVVFGKPHGQPEVVIWNLDGPSTESRR